MASARQTDKSREAGRRTTIGTSASTSRESSTNLGRGGSRAMNRRVLPVLVAACVLAWATLVVSAQGRGNPEAAKVKNPIPSTAKSIADGQKAYQTNCRHCHGAKGLGDGP